VTVSLFASAWTFGGLEACLREVEMGLFDGVEGPPPATSAEVNALRGSRVPYIAEICSGGSYAPASSVPVLEHLADMQTQVANAVDAGALFCTCLVGSDSWPTAKAVEFFGRALSLGNELGAELSFETHRSRPTFHPWATAELLRALPTLRLTCDFSHWCVVCERLPDDEAALALAISRARHIHARVGYAQGPQVPDPRAPEFEAELAAHESWWQRIALSVAARGESVTVTPEFGPDGYLHHTPFSNQPVADLAEINRWMAQRQRARLNSAEPRVASTVPR
jgi:sugar phosphate isomerase/epimerase